MKIVLFGNIYRNETLRQVERVLHYFKQQSVDIQLEKSLCEVVSEGKQYREFDSQAAELPDIALSIGGDGTFLTTASRIGSSNIPILGINCGRLGFLADVANNEVENVLNDILQNRYTIEQRSVLQVVASDGSAIQLPYALNEVAVLKQDLSSMISVETMLNEEHLHTYQADGLIIATPTGSTAYNMSVGGPLMVPQSKDLILTPVASHSLNVRPLVIPDDWEIHLKIKSRSQSYLVSIDGRSQIMSQTTELTIIKAPFTVKIVKPEAHSFLNSLKNKLMWGADKRN